MLPRFREASFFPKRDGEARVHRAEIWRRLQGSFEMLDGFGRAAAAKQELAELAVASEVVRSNLESLSEQPLRLVGLSADSDPRCS